MGEGFNPAAVPEGHVMAARVKDRQQGAEDGDGGRVEPARIELINPQPGVEQPGQGDQVIGLRQADGCRQAAIIAGATDKTVDFKERQRDFVF